MLYTAKQAAEQLGVSYKRLCWLAQHYKVGSKMPRMKIWVFSKQDLDTLQARRNTKTGRPPSQE
jgi:hypothetical protein